MATLLRVNLLPEGARKAGLSHVEQLHRTPLMWLAAGLMIVIALLAWAPMPLRNTELRRLNSQIAVLQPKMTAVQEIQRILRQLQAQEAAFRGMGKDQSLWAKRLNTLSNVTPDGVWFTELSLDDMKGLVIQGAALQQISVTRLVQDLKADTGFAAGMKEMQIESIKAVQDGEVEVVQFTLACSLNEPAKAN